MLVSKSTAVDLLNCGSQLREPFPFLLTAALIVKLAVVILFWDEQGQVNGRT